MRVKNRATFHAEVYLGWCVVVAGHFGLAGLIGGHGVGLQVVQNRRYH